MHRRVGESQRVAGRQPVHGASRCGRQAARVRGAVSPCWSSAFWLLFDEEERHSLKTGLQPNHGSVCKSSDSTAWPTSSTELVEFDSTIAPHGGDVVNAA